MSEIQQRIAALEAQLADLKAQVGGEPTEVLASRRDFAKKAALGVAGLAAAGVAGSVVGAGSASADTGSGLLLGNTQFAANMTRIMEIDGVWVLGDSRYRNALLQPRVMGFRKHPVLATEWLYVDLSE